MAGNSMRSDVLPALEAGAWAAFIPYEIVWAHEAADAPIDHPRFLELGSLGELVSWLDNEAAGDEQPLAKIVPG
jgi:putative hydrolase of the HAD superfamily